MAPLFFENLKNFSAENLRKYFPYNIIPSEEAYESDNYANELILRRVEPEMREYYKPTVNDDGGVDILIVKRKTWDSFDTLAEAEEEVILGNNRAYRLFPIFFGWACFGRILFGIGKLIYLFASGTMRIY